MEYLYLADPVHKNIFNIDKIKDLDTKDLLISFDGTIVAINKDKAIKNKSITDIRLGYKKIPDNMISGDIDNEKDFYTFLSIMGFE